MISRRNFTVRYREVKSHTRSLAIMFARPLTYICTSDDSCHSVAPQKQSTGHHHGTTKESQAQQSCGPHPDQQRTLPTHEPPSRTTHQHLPPLLRRSQLIQTSKEQILHRKVPPLSCTSALGQLGTPRSRAHLVQTLQGKPGHRCLARLGPRHSRSSHCDETCQSHRTVARCLQPQC